MKSLKKNSFSLALGFSMLLGVAFASLPAKAEDEAFGGKVNCWTAGSGEGEYLHCLTCVTRPLAPAGPMQKGCNPAIM